MSTAPSSSGLSHRQLLERSEALTKENAALCQTLKAYREKSVNISHLVDKYKQLQVLCKDLQGQNEKLSGEVDKARKTLSTTNKTSCQPGYVQKLESNVEKLTAERDAVQQKLSTCKTERDQMEAKLEEETARSCQLANERDELAAAAMDTRILIKDCALEISQLRSEVRALKASAADRFIDRSTAIEIASIKAQLAVLEQRVSERSSAQADADIASLSAQQHKTAVELHRIRAVFSAAASPADNRQLTGACSPSPLVHLDAPVQTRVEFTQCRSHPSPAAANAPSAVSGPTALQRMRSSSPDVVLASATGHSIPQQQPGACAASVAGNHDMQPLTNTPSAAEAAAPRTCMHFSRSGSPMREDSSPPSLMRSPTRCSTVGDTTTHSDGIPGPEHPAAATTVAPVPGPRTRLSPDASTRKQEGPRKRPRPAAARNSADDKVAPSTTAGPAAPAEVPASRRVPAESPARPLNPLKRRPPQSQAARAGKTGAAAPATKVRSCQGSESCAARLLASTACARCEAIAIVRACT